MVAKVEENIERITAATDRYPAKVTTLPEYGTVAIRVRCGNAGYTEWMNELQVYLLPNFNHSNFLEYLKSDMHHTTENDALEEDGKQQAHSSRHNESKDSRSKHRGVQYTLINGYEGCQTLREFLKSNTLTWSQMIAMAKGIASGLYYLHENADYQNFNEEKMIDGFIRSTRDAIARVSFMTSRSSVTLQPHITLSIIHRNLSSENIAIKPDLTPCIWNFGSSYVHHPFQPTNCKYIIDPELREVYMTSPYSPPEVLQNRGHLTLASMQSIDMYACGILFWELMTRTMLPRLDIANLKEDRERDLPGEYKIPFQEEFRDLPMKEVLVYAVCKMGARPRIKNCWMLGKKTNEFTQTMQDLWDHDFDARLHSSTVVDRLERISISNRDARRKYRGRRSNYFDIATMWPPRIDSSIGVRYHEEQSQPKIRIIGSPKKAKLNIVTQP